MYFVREKTHDRFICSTGALESCASLSQTSQWKDWKNGETTEDQDYLQTKTISKPSTTTWWQMMKVHVQGQPRKEGIKGVVCSIRFEYGTKFIGETGRTLQIRVAKYQWTVKNKNMNNGIAFHGMMNNHKIQWEQTKYLRQSHTGHRKKWKKMPCLSRKP